MADNLIVALCNGALKQLSLAHELYRQHYGDEVDADWVSEQYNNACISIERIRDAAKLDRRGEDG